MNVPLLQWRTCPEIKLLAKNKMRTVEFFEHEGKRYFLKRYHYAQRGLGLEECKGLQLVKDLGIRVPNVVAAGKGYFLSEEVEGSRSVEDFLESLGAHQPVPRALLESVAQTVKRLHDAKIAHKDLYLGHLFWDERERQITLIDLARARRHRIFFLRWRIKDLASLLFSSSLLKRPMRDKIHFFKMYRNCGRLRTMDKWMLRLVQRKAQRIARHTARVLNKRSVKDEVRQDTPHNSIQRILSNV